MKKYVIAIAMMLTIGMNAGAASQSHRHTPRTVQVDSAKNNQDAIEAFSDTTSVVDSTYDEDRATSRNVNVSLSGEDVKSVIDEVMSNVDDNAIFGMLTALGVLFILFVLFPIIIIIGIVYLINRNRRDRYKLAQMAVQNGQPIPDQLLKEEAIEHSDDYQKGLRQMFTGIGLAIFLGIWAGEVGFGIGALVFFIGLGKWYIARQARGNGDNPTRNNDNINNSNIQNYD